MTDSGRVAVIGAGWAGIAAAVSLVERGIPTILFDAAPQPGGRARTAPALGIEVDNGQHIAIGAYTAVLDLARSIGLAPERVFVRIALTLQQRDATGILLSLRAPKDAGQVGLAFAFATARGLSAGQKLKMARNWPRLLNAPATDISVSEFLRAVGQPERAIKLLWDPLCIATLNTAPDRASAQLFVRVLKESFDAACSGAADLMLPACDLGAALPQPAVAWLHDRGVAVHLGERITGLETDGRRFKLATGRREYEVRSVVVAVPPDSCARLIEGIPALASVAATYARIGTQPICTVYLRYPPEVALPFPVLGLTGTTTQWLVDRRTCAQDGVIAAVISADGPHMALSNEELISLVQEEIGRCVPELPPASDARVIREKRATFDAVVGIEALRPAAATAVPGLVLAGDWTATGLPATLEGAVRSGRTAAEMLLQIKPTVGADL
ncbi:MAG: hydroxysqualene dehydroxylase HpnE [Xanthomonadaceae bacterium]|nr:hydroxysqualene dehydroxylase HpnE [Xanthomonadaceae bacterium]